MIKITVADLARALQEEALYPANNDMVREWAETGILPCWRNPAREQGWHFVNILKLEDFLFDHVGLTDVEVAAVLQGLKIKKKTSA